MTSDVGHPCLHRWLVAALLLMSFGVLAPSTSRAGCVHAVSTKAGAAHAEMIGLDRLTALRALSFRTWRGGSPGEFPPSPCAGLRCSRNSDAPLTAPPTVSRIDAWGCLQICAFALQIDSSPWVIEEVPPPPLDRADRLARPPR
jgi:hypothetical protein